MTVRVPINGSTLAWARLSFGMDEESLGRAAGVSGQKVLEFESNDLVPTLNQLREMAKKLDRPLAFFFTDVPSESDIPQTVDYRNLSGEGIPSNLIREIRRADTARTTLLEISEDEVPLFQFSEINRQNVISRAREVRSQLGLSPEYRPSSPQPNEVFNYWRHLLEEHGILTFQTTRIKLNVYRGLSINYDRYPLILINGADSPNGKIFTLFHELAHLMNSISGLCMLTDQTQIESTCNEFAANVLMPEEPFKNAFLNSPSENRVLAVSHEFRVSRLAAAIRLQRLQLLTQSAVEQIRTESEEIWRLAQERQAASEGFVPPWRLKYRDLSPTYMGAIFEALNSNRVNYVDASYFLNAKLPMIETMRTEFFRGVSA